MHMHARSLSLVRAALHSARSGLLWRRYGAIVVPSPPFSVDTSSPRMDLLSRLADIAAQLQQLDEQLADPNVYGDPKAAATLSRKRAELLPIAAVYTRMRDASARKAGAEQMIETESDAELLAMAREELAEAKQLLAQAEEDAVIALLPKDPLDSRNIIIEIRPAAGGDESAIFAGELGRMYMAYAAALGYTTELIEHMEGDKAGSAKFLSFKVDGHGAYSHFKFESGVHRVQRVPETESQGRIHTSTVTVAVLPEAEETDLEIRAQDLRIDVFRASGAGGQAVNKTESAVRITHIPTGMVGASQESRSQLKNREIAMTLLRSRLLAAEQERRDSELASARSSQVGSGDRSEKIRTYNFPQDRLTDHRINQNFSNLPGIMAGDMTKMIQALQMDEQTRLLAGAHNADA